jgi:hypothetical protein
MVIRIIGLIASVAGLAYSLVSLAYLAWLSATRLTPAQLQTAKLYAAVWFGIAAACAAVSIWLIVSIVRLRAAGRRGRGFEVG